MTKLPLTVCILTTGSDTRVVKAVESVSAFASEIVIGVTTQDQSALKLLKHPVVIHKMPSVDSFSVARNQLQQVASQSWILWLDTDEVVSPALREKIPQLLLSNKVSAYALKRVDFWKKRAVLWGEVRSVFIPRLVRKGSGRFARAVHEFMQVQGSVVKVHEPIWHYSHTGVAEFIAKVIQYAKLESQFRYESNNRLRTYEFAFPLLKFLRSYVFLFGFLDGFAGILYAVCMSLHSLMVRVYLYELEHNEADKS